MLNRKELYKLQAFIFKHPPSAKEYCNQLQTPFKQSPVEATPPFTSLSIELRESSIQSPSFSRPNVHTHSHIYGVYNQIKYTWVSLTYKASLHYKINTFEYKLIGRAILTQIWDFQIDSRESWSSTSYKMGQNTPQKPY